MESSLTSDQLIHGSLLSDLKAGRLGDMPKVVIVHPDGTVEEVTSKLHTLAQEKSVEEVIVANKLEEKSMEEVMMQIVDEETQVCMLQGKSNLFFVFYQYIKCTCRFSLPLCITFIIHNYCLFI